MPHHAPRGAGSPSTPEMSAGARSLCGRDHLLSATMTKLGAKVPPPPGCTGQNCPPKKNGLAPELRAPQAATPSRPERGNEFSPLDTDCHVALRRGHAHPTCTENGVIKVRPTFPTHKLLLLAAQCCRNVALGQLVVSYSSRIPRDVLCLFCAKETLEDFQEAKRIGGDMSRDLGPAERRVCRMVFAFLAVMILGFLVLNAIEFLFDSLPPVWKVVVHPDTRNSLGPDPKYPNQPSHFRQNSDPQPRKQWAEGPEADEPARVSLLTMKARLEQLGARALEMTVRFDPEPLERRVDAHNVGFAEIAPQPVLTESFQIGQAARIVTANATPEPPSVTPPQELNAPERQSAPPLSKSKEASTTAEAFTEEQVLHIKSRLRDLGFLSSAKAGGWDASTRNALRDFKAVNSLSNDDIWDLTTSNKLNSQRAIRADHSIIGNWSTAPCRSAKPTDIRLSISSRRSKSSAGSVCEFHNLKVTAREWRVQANCSHGDKRWTANGKFSLTADKLVWTSDHDVIGYFRCN
jgi:hypothetical protein